MNTTTNSSAGIVIGDWLLHPAFQALLGVLILLIVSFAAYCALAKLRGSTNQDHGLHEALQKNFEEMRSEGDISETEFRRISSVIEDARVAPKPPGSNTN